ncbi:MAG: organic solvent tolerance ABC transporter substrate-binding protein [Candidatus Rokuibacteriota bacterium]|nr:MAG: organic solvent tolerance ABC transporter substrate-binding protein [Candidatus Rokubacteria bacterium]
MPIRHPARRCRGSMRADHSASLPRALSCRPPVIRRAASAFVRIKDAAASFRVGWHKRRTGKPMRALTMALVLVCATGAAHAMTPTETVQGRVDKALQTLGQTSGATPEGAERRRAEIRQIADGLFDFTEMSRRALGRHWADRSQAERDEFVRLFSDLIARAYLGKMDRYTGESITYVGERVEGDLATVNSLVITAKKSEVPIEYRLRRVGDRWAAYDILIDNVSLAGTYRSQFDRIIQTSSFAELLKRLKQKEQEPATATPAR